MAALNTPGQRLHVAARACLCRRMHLALKGHLVGYNEWSP